MGILLVSIISFILICIVINLIDKNKEKLIEKFRLEKLQVMKCPRCYNTYEDMSLHFCKHCNTSLEKEIKYKLPKGLKKKIIYIVLGIIGIAVIAVCSYIGISNYIKEQQRIEKYNNDLQSCYTVIKNDSSWKKFNNLLKEHTEESTFETEAYSNLYKAIDERLENVKDGNDDEQLLSMLKEVKEETSTTGYLKDQIEERYLKANSYSNINKANKQIAEQKYIEAYQLLNTVINSNKDKNQDIIDICTNKQNEIKEQTLQQVTSQAQEKINNKEYSSAQTLLGKYKDMGNQTIVDMYNNATNEVNRIEAEKKAQEEAERKAKEKKEAEEKARKEAEEKARKKSQGVRIGMSKQDVLDSSWGEPDHINTTTTRYGVHEQWVYGGGNYLYFENGILTSIQN